MSALSWVCSALIAKVFGIALLTALSGLLIAVIRSRLAPDAVASAAPRREDSHLPGILRKGIVLALCVSILVTSVVITGWQGISQLRARTYEEHRVREAAGQSINDPGQLLERLGQLPLDCAYIEREGGDLPLIGGTGAACGKGRVRSRVALDWEEPFRGSLVFALNDSALPSESPALLVLVFAGVAAAVILTGWILLQLLNASVIYPLRALTLGLAGSGPPQALPSACEEIAQLASELERLRERPATSEIDAILVDDDPLVRMSWKHAARRSGKRLLAFSSPDELRPRLTTLARTTPLYIDSDLGHGFRGEELARELSELGFSELYLATGHPPERFRHCTWIKGVLGKDPPWA